MTALPNDPPTRLAAALLPHQLVAVDWLFEGRRRLLADEPGLGKTLSALGLAERLSDTAEWTGRGCRVLVVTEANLIPQWAGEVERWCPQFSVATTQHRRWKEGRPKAHRDYQTTYGPTGPDVLVTSYDLLPSRLDAIAATCKPCLVILDEVSAVKGGGKQFHALCELTRAAARVVGLTATPVENNPLEAWRILYAAGTPNLWPEGTFSGQFVTWEPGYRHPRSGQWVPAQPLDFVQARLPEIQAYTAEHVLARSADDAGLVLPERVGEQLRFVNLHPVQQKAYDRADAIGNPLVASSRKESSARVTAGESSLVDAGIAELKMTKEKTVVYCENLKVLALMAERMTLEGIQFVQVDGSVIDQARQQALAAFRDDPDVQVLLGSKVLEYGLNLQHCRRMISLDNSWNPSREDQREHRICRIGSPHATYQHLVLVPQTEQAARAKQNTLERKSTLLGRFLGRNNV